MTTKTLRQLQEERAELNEEIINLVEKSKQADLTKSEFRRYNDLRDKKDAIDVEIELTKKSIQNLSTEAGEWLNGTPDKGVRVSMKGEECSLTDVVKRAHETGKATFDVKDAKQLLGIHNRVITPSSNGGSNVTVMSADDSVLLQSTPNTDFLSRFRTVTTENNRRYAYWKRGADRPVAETKGYTDALTGTDGTMSAYTVGLHNYYVYLTLHNDIYRDAIGGLDEAIRNAVATSIREKVATDILFGAAGGNNLQGMETYTGVQSYNYASGTIDDYSILLRARQMLLEKNVNWSNCSVIMSPAVGTEFAELKGTVEMQPLMMPRAIENLQNSWYETNLITVDGNSESKMIVGDLSQFTLFIGGEFEMILKERRAEYDQSIYMVVARFDLQSAQPDHVVYFDNIAVGQTT